MYVAHTEPGASGTAQVAYAVSRRCGTAVQRNRVRRRLRAAVQTAATDGLVTGSYLLRPDPELASLDHPSLVTLVATALHDAAQRGVRRTR
jgi:RNase P protein component